MYEQKSKHLPKVLHIANKHNARFPIEDIIFFILSENIL
jgi:hypothetical protein